MKGLIEKELLRHLEEGKKLNLTETMIYFRNTSGVKVGKALLKKRCENLNLEYY